MNEPLWLNECELVGTVVTLRPLRASDAQGLMAAASDGRLWELWFTGVPSPASIEQYLASALSEQSQGRALPFVVVDNASGNVIGSTRFCNATPQHRRVEIGYTWYAQRFQRSAVNTECKYLLLGHAFEHLSAIAVEFRTHWHNRASREAIARLGAKQDGVLRNHQIESEGGFRDTVVFSILESEWPVVKKGLAFERVRRQFATADREPGG
ncbi:GNAT family N-acetyltransferase [Marinobacter caseinilyticus]|uniref:GNAT family N-acetyltransferase n=1 Tax=Marinobacter caseinilyticus TaxID=2692195 RepID=UPI00140DD39A|nr:GNAT family protein [Marinobacter caseinilyticus]